MSYKTVKAFASASFIEKKSEFIGYISPVRTNDEAVAFINSIKAENRKARHNVYAYILRDSNITRYSDDGEPQGTGGVPVLEVLQKEGLYDVCVVVTRYFGGILLGTGGLTRAYSKGCKLAIEAAQIMQMHKAYTLTVTTNYSLYGKISPLLPSFEAKVLATDFSNDVTISIMVMSDKTDALKKKIVDETFGTVKLKISDEYYGDFA
ncbi:MAG: YigZ family protein [Ruminococcus sp.]|nr:YigZ family protein [Ruminococcus sp.]